MAKKRAANKNNGDAAIVPDGVHLDRIAKTLALIASKELETTERIGFLASIGFSIAEIAQMLRMKYGAVQVSLHRMKKAKPKRGKD